MRFRNNTKVVVEYIWRVPLCAFAYIDGAMAGAGLVSAIGMKLPPIPEQANEQTMGLCLLIGSFALAIGLGPVLLVLHNVEILADSVVYAGVLAVLFVQKDGPEFTAVGDLGMAQG